MDANRQDKPARSSRVAQAGGIPRRLPNGNLLVPVRLEGEDGTIGDAVEEISAGTPEFRQWLAWMKRRDAALRKPGRAAPNA